MQKVFAPYLRLVLCFFAVVTTIYSTPKCYAEDSESNVLGTSSRLVAEAPPASEAQDNTYAELDPEELSRMESDTIYLRDSHTTTVIFKQAKQIAGPIGFGHLIWEINLGRSHHGFKMSTVMVNNLTVDIAKGWYSDSRYSDTLQRQLLNRIIGFNDTIQQTHQEWLDLVSVFSPAEFRLEYLAKTQPPSKETKSDSSDEVQDRKPRAVGVIVSIIMTIVGAVGGFFSATQLSELSNTDESDSLFIVKELATLGTAKNLQEKQLWELRARLNRAELLSASEHSAMVLAEYETYFSRQASLYRLDRERQTRGLEGLLRKQLSPSLVSPRELKQAVSQLKKQAERNGYSLPSDQELYLYQLEAGFVLVRPDVIHVSIHVPMYKRSEVLQLYEAITMPLILPHSRHNLDIQLESRMIAVRGRGQGYKLMEPWQLTACSSMAGVLFCPGEDHMLKDFSMHCIAALFHEPLKVSKVCRAVLIPPQVKVVQLEARTFQVFHPTDMTLHQACPEGVQPDVSFKGTKLVVLNSGCWAYTDAYELAAPQDISLNFSTKTAETVWGGENLLRGMTPSQINVVVPAKLFSPVPIDDVLAKYTSHKNDQQTTNWLEVTGIIFACIAVTISLIALISFCKREAIRSSLHAFIVKHPHVAQLVKLLPGYLQPDIQNRRTLLGKRRTNDSTHDITAIAKITPIRDEVLHRRRQVEQSVIDSHTRQREALARAYWGADEPDDFNTAERTRIANIGNIPYIAARRQAAAIDRDVEDQQRVELWRSFNPRRESELARNSQVPTGAPTAEELNYLSEGPHGPLTRTVEAELGELRGNQTWRVVPSRRQLRRPAGAAADTAAETEPNTTTASATPSAPTTE